MRKVIKKASKVISDFIPALTSGIDLDHFSKHTITSTQHITIMAICHFRKCTMGELAHNLHVSMPTVTGIIDRLIDSNFVKRSMSNEDRRVVYVELTAKGKKLVKGFQAFARARWEKLFQALTDKEIRAFEKIMRKLKDHIDKKTPN